MIPIKAFKELLKDNPTIRRQLVKKVYKNGKLVGFVFEE